MFEVALKRAGFAVSCSRTVSWEIPTKLIKQEIEMSCGSCEYYTQFMDSIKEWWKSSNYFVSESAKFWENILRSHIANISENKWKVLKKLNVRFREEELIAVITQPNVTIIDTGGSAGNLVLSCLKIHRSLSGMVHIMRDVKTLQMCMSEVLALWGRGTYCNILVVEDVVNMVAGVASVLNSRADKQLVVISGGTSPLVSKLHEHIQCTDYKDTFRFSQLETLI
jgi:hypothetical protein